MTQPDLSRSGFVIYMYCICMPFMYIKLSKKLTLLLAASYTVVNEVNKGVQYCR